MITPFKKGLITAAFIGSVLIPGLPAFAQTYTTGSTGSPQATSYYTNCPVLNYNLYYGMAGSDVTVLQSFLAVQGYFPYSPIGVYGPLTFRAVQNFQAAHGISSTGYVGPITRGVINSLQNCNNPVPPLPPPSAAPYIQAVYPSTGPVGTTVTISGYGFTNNSTVYFGGSSFANTYSSNGTNLSFTIPQYLSPNCPPGAMCALWVRQVTPGTYSIYIQNQNGTSNTVNFTVTDTTTTSQPVSITGIDAPATIRVGETGTWVVHSNLPSYVSGSNIHYSVVWGDEGQVDLPYPAAVSAPIQTSATFTHSYRTSGTYHPTFTVTNDAGQTASASATLVVSY